MSFSSSFARLLAPVAIVALAAPASAAVDPAVASVEPLSATITRAISGWPDSSFNNRSPDTTWPMAWASSNAGTMANMACFLFIYV